MDKATSKMKLNHCRVSCGGHQAVVTNLTKEINEILLQEMLAEEHCIRLSVIGRQLEAKSSILANLDKGCWGVATLERLKVN